MKNIFTCCLIFFLSNSLYSQTTEFAPVGARWWYDQVQAFEPQNSYWLYESKKDTMYDGKIFRKILRSEISSTGETLYNADPVFIYQEDEKLYITFDVTDTAMEYFDFTAEPGDTIRTIALYDINEYAISIVDSIKTVNLLGIDITAYYLHNAELSGEYLVGFTSVFYETIGSTAYFFPWDGLVDPPEGGLLRCYEDDSIGLIKFSEAETCEFIVSTDEYISSSFNVFPNPVTDKLSLSGTSDEDLHIELIDITGKQIIINFEHTNSGNVVADISAISPGVYFVTMYSENRIIGTQKICKL